VVEFLRPQCIHHRPLAYTERANGGFGDISRSEPTPSQSSGCCRSMLKSSRNAGSQGGYASRVHRIAPSIVPSR
jgi:hypothetical protein